MLQIVKNICTLPLRAVQMIRERQYENLYIVSPEEQKDTTEVGLPIEFAKAVYETHHPRDKEARKCER